LGKDIDTSLLISRVGIDATNVRRLDRSHLASSGKIRGVADAAGDRMKSTVESEQDRPLGFVRWFETTSVGFEASPGKGGTRITDVTNGSVAARSGLRKGDVITAIDGEAVKDSVEDFRKQVRRGSVQDGCIVTVTRDNEVRSLVFDFRAEGGK
jgi:S1-C subfamily serine protease